MSVLSSFTRRRWRLGSAMTAALVVGASLMVTQPAYAAIPDGPPCYGATCVGRDPNIADSLGFSCLNGVTNLITVTWGNTYTLRWSDFCHANWAKAVDNNTDYYVQTSDGHKEWGRGYYSDMVNGDELARLCYTAIDGNPSDYYCTGWY